MKNVILVGNPNVGKTTLFNTLTKSNDKASNWHGVTVGVKEKDFRYHGEEFKAVDLPGLYSLEGYSNEEKIACDYLKKNKDNLIVNICDANNLKRNMILTKQLLDNSYNVILAVNMINEQKGMDLKKLSEVLSVPIVGIDARKNKSVEDLKNAILSYYNEKNAYFSDKINKINISLEKIDKIIDEINKNLPYETTNKIDKIVLNKFLFFPIFLLVVFSVFYLTFGPFGEFVSSIIENIFNKIYGELVLLVKNLKISLILKDFFILGILNSAMSILAFLPQIILLMTFINIIEDIGLMSRIAFMFDGLLSKIGLTGKSLFSIMMGYGCTATAVITTRNLEKKSLRTRTALVLPFSTCSAKLPIFLVISSLFFEKYKYLFVFGLYIISVILLVIFAWVFKKLLPDKKTPFVLEMPKYRLPYLKKIFKDSLSVAFEFFYKVGTTIILAGAFFWLLQNFSCNFDYLAGEDFSKSILFTVSSKLAVFFKPIGLDEAGIVAVLFFGLIAKELVIVGLSQVNMVGSDIELLSKSLVLPTSVCYFTKTSSIIFLLFTLIYSPCISSLSTIKNELGLKTSVFVFVFQILVAYLICFLCFMSLKNINFLIAVASTIILAILISFVVKLTHKSKCKGNCNACRKI